MSWDAPLSRRAVLHWVGLWLAIAGTPSAVRSRAASEDRHASMPSGGAGGSHSLLDARQSAARIGRAYLETAPEEASAAELLESLGLAELDLEALDKNALAEKRIALRRVHRHDFVAGRVVEVGGFTFSLTEMRLAGLVALSDA